MKQVDFTRCKYGIYNYYCKYYYSILFTLAKPRLVCAAKYQEDDLWYRAEILETLQPSSVQVKYIDFGNKEWLNFKRWV